MNDVLEPCGHCNHEHRVGIVRHSIDGVPLYGARKCETCGCEQFAQKQGNVPTLPADEIKALWQATSFLNAQVPAATRIAVRQIMDLFSPKEGEDANNYLPAPLMRGIAEFAGLLISQTTDVRAALTRDDNKFAHLVAHTDEIVESMRGVVQLSERLEKIYTIQERTLEQLERLTDKVSALEAGQTLPKPDNVVSLAEAAHTFLPGGPELWNEPIVTDAREVDADSE